jgi:biopolymer transport protein ExbB
MNSLLFMLLQAGTEIEGIEEGVTIETQSVMDIIFGGGPIGIVIYLIQFVVSILALYIFVERYLTINKASKIDHNFMNNIRMSVQSGNIPAAKALCQSTDSPIARMVEKGLQRIGKPLDDIDKAIENVGNLEIFKMEKNLSSLASIAGAAPMIGFFGTVTGMILSFYEMASQQNVTPDVLAGGIYQALLTTAIGLATGIPAMLGYNILVSRVDKVVFKMESHTIEFMDLLQEPA